MTVLLKEIMSRAEGVLLADIQGPTGVVEEGEKIIGTLPDDLKRLFVVLTIAEREKNEVKHQISKIDNLLELNERQATEALKTYRLASSRYDLVHTCFWNSVRHAFPEIVLKSSIGLREKWQVVIDTKSSLSAILASLLPGLGD